MSGNLYVNHHGDLKSSTGMEKIEAAIKHGNSSVFGNACIIPVLCCANAGAPNRPRLLPIDITGSYNYRYFTGYLDPNNPAFKNNKEKLDRKSTRLNSSHVD